jgi:catalase
MGKKKTGPALLEDQIGREKIHRFDHERIPERVVHARGAGAHGTFHVYDDRLAKYTSAGVLTDPKRETPAFVRFSTVQGSRGSADTGKTQCACAWCDLTPLLLASARRARLRGQVLHRRRQLGPGWVSMASCWCYRTSHIHRNNIPVFFIQDGMQFPDFVHAVKPEPHNDVGYSHVALSCCLFQACRSPKDSRR